MPHARRVARGAGARQFPGKNVSRHTANFEFHATAPSVIRSPDPRILPFKILRDSSLCTFSLFSYSHPNTERVTFILSSFFSSSTHRHVSFRSRTRSQCEQLFIFHDKINMNRKNFEKARHTVRQWHFYLSHFETRRTSR